LPAHGVDALHERLDRARLEMIERDRDPDAAGSRHELGGLLDRLGAPADEAYKAALRGPWARRARRMMAHRFARAERTLG